MIIERTQREVTQKKYTSVFTKINAVFVYNNRYFHLKRDESNLRQSDIRKPSID